MSSDSRVELMTGPDNRAIAAHVVDCHTPRWVFIFHGIADSGGLVEHAADAAAEAGVGLVAVNRPGYGATAPAPPGIEVTLSDLWCVADRLGIEQLAALGLSGGGAFACAAAAASSRVTALGVAAGVGPWREVEPDRSSWDLDDVRAADFADEGRFDEAADIVLKGCVAAFIPLLAMTDDQIADAVVPAGIEGGSSRASLVSSLREALTTFDGVIYDNLTLDMRPSWDPGKIVQPSHVWHGDADETVSIANAEWFARQIAGSRLTVFDGEGHGSVVLGHFPEYLAALAPAVS